jgi:hypothetical protein
MMNVNTAMVDKGSMVRIIATGEVGRCIRATGAGRRRRYIVLINGIEAKFRHTELEAI